MWGFAEVERSEAEGVEPGTRVFGYLPPSSHLVGDAGRRRRGRLRRRLAAPGRAALRLPPLPGDRRRSVLPRRHRGDPDAAAAALLHLVPDRRPARRRGADDARPDPDLQRLEQDRDRRRLPARAARRGRAGRPHLAAQRRVRRGPGDLRPHRRLRRDRLARAAAPPPSSTSPATARCAARSTRTTATSSSTAWRWASPTGRSSAPAPASCPAHSPSFFFAPDRVIKRAEDWGRAGLETRVADAWHPFCEWTGGWLETIPGKGFDAVRDAYLDVLEGRVDPDARPRAHAAVTDFDGAVAPTKSDARSSAALSVADSADRLAEHPLDVGAFVLDLMVGEAEAGQARCDMRLVANVVSGLGGRRYGGSASRRSRRPSLARARRSRPRTHSPHTLVSGSGRPAAVAIGRKRISRSESERRKVCLSKRIRSGPDPWFSGVAVERGAQGLGIDEVALVGLVDRSLERPWSSARWRGRAGCAPGR